MEESEEYKKCHVCAEDIKSQALKCRYCGATVAKEKIIENGNFTSKELNPTPREIREKVVELASNFPTDYTGL